MSEEDNKDTQEVLEFLQTIEETQEQEKSLLEKVEQSVELTPEEKEELEGSLEQEQEYRNIDVPEIPVQDNFKHKPYQDMFTALVADIGKVEVSNYEKDLFIKSVLNDTKFTTISYVLGGKLPIEVKSRTMFTDKLIFDSLNKDEQEKRVLGLDSMVFRLQMYMAACQVKSYGSKDTDFDPDHTKDFDYNYDKLNAHVDKVLSNIPVHVWGAIVMGIRIHEYKSKICLDNLNNENFWESAGIN
jgi:hypothetical protein